MWTTQDRMAKWPKIGQMGAGSGTQQIVTVDGAREQGLSRWQLERQVGQRQTRGIYVITRDPVGRDLRARALLAGCGQGAVLSHFTAAEILGGWVPARVSIHVTIPERRRIRRPEVVTHRSSRTIRTTTVRGLPVTDAIQTFLDLATHLELVDLVALGDSFVAHRLTSPEELISAAAEWRGYGVARAREAARFVRANVGSRRETWLRMLMVTAGLPEPTIDHRIYASDGTLLFRIDLAYEEFKVGIEYDGRQHAESDAQWGHDVDRREYFDGASWRLVIVIGKHFYRDAGDILRRIVGAARAQGMTIPDPNPRWRQYFTSYQSV